MKISNHNKLKQNPPQNCGGFFFCDIYYIKTMDRSTKSIFNFIRDYWLVLAAIASIGGLYTEIKIERQHRAEKEATQQKFNESILLKIEEIEKYNKTELDERVDYIEEEMRYEKGFIDAMKTKK